MSGNNIKNMQKVEDDLYMILLSAGVNLEYYDHVIWSKDYLEQVKDTKSMRFWTSGITFTLSNGNERTILFIWERYYDQNSANKKMKKILMNLSQEDLEEMSKRSLKQSLKRIRKTKINLN